jgi:hypothetical protein
MIGLHRYFVRQVVTQTEKRENGKNPGGISRNGEE